MGSDLKLMNEHDWEFLSLTRDCPGSSESTLVNMPHCWKSHATVQIISPACSPTNLPVSTGSTPHLMPLLVSLTLLPFNPFYPGGLSHRYIEGLK